MAGARKHGGHRHNLQNVLITAATATLPAIWTYDPFAENLGGSGASTAGAGYDGTVEQIVEMNLTLSASLTGQVTNFTTFRITHRNAAGTTIDQFSVVASTTAYIFVAFIPANLGVASGATIPGGGTGTLTVGTGVALPWTLTVGDTISLDTTVTGSGQYAGGIAVNFVVAQKGA
jgi:hypothetical protein